MPFDPSRQRNESVFSTKLRAGKRRTYFFDVRKTRGEDFYITLTESTKRGESQDTERQKIHVYKEDFNNFLSNLQEVIDHVKTNLMPDYNYDFDPEAIKTRMNTIKHDLDNDKPRIEDIDW